MKKRVQEVLIDKKRSFSSMVSGIPRLAELRSARSECQAGNVAVAVEKSGRFLLKNCEAISLATRPIPRLICKRSIPLLTKGKEKPARNLLAHAGFRCMPVSKSVTPAL